MAANDNNKGGGGGFFVSLIVLTLIGAAFGIGFKMFVMDAGEAPASVKAVEAAPGYDKAAAGKGHGNSDDHGEKSGDANSDGATGGAEKHHGNALIPLAPIVTGFAQPSNAWVRLEGTVVFKDKPEAGYKAVATEIASDVMNYLRTLTPSQVAGPAGLEFLADDLSDIARVRSAGAAEKFLIMGLIIE